MRIKRYSIRVNDTNYSSETITNSAKMVFEDIKNHRDAVLNMKANGQRVVIPYDKILYAALSPDGETEVERGNGFCE